MRTRRPPLAVLVLACALAAPAPALAQSFYDVEIIVFEQRDAGGGERERWRPRVVVPGLEDATAFERDGARAEVLVPPPRGFQPLPIAGAQLQAERERLEESEHYRVLRHLRWRQPALAGDETVALRVRAGEPMVVRVPAEGYTAAPRRGTGADGRGDEAGGAVGREAPSAGTGGTPSRERAGGDATVTPYGGGVRAAGPFGGDTLVPRTREVRVYPLDGTIRLIVTRYLHVYTDLYYTTAVEWLDDERADTAARRGRGAPADAPAPGHPGVAGAATAPRLARDAEGRALLSYPFVQRRRMRSDELHYLDHPVLGMLVRVTPRGDATGAPDAGAS